PERRVDGADGRHRHRPSPPVRPFVEILPRVLDASRVAADEQRDDVVREIAGDGELSSVERRVAEAVDAVLRDELQRDEVAARTADDDLAFDDAHSWFPRGRSAMADAPASAVPISMKNPTS